MEITRHSGGEAQLASAGILQGLALSSTSACCTRREGGGGGQVSEATAWVYHGWSIGL